MIINVLWSHSILRMCSISLGKVDNFAKNFNNFREKIWFFLRENVTIFARKYGNFCKKIWWLFQENPPTFTGNLTVFPGNLDDFSRKVWLCLQKHLMIFQENLMIFAVKSADSYFQLVRMFFIIVILIQAKLVRFCCKNRQFSCENS